MKQRFFPAFLLGAVIFMITGQLCAKTLSMGYLTGDVVAGELTSARYEIITPEKFPYNCNFSKPLYVLVSLKMHSRRSISVFDYKMVINRISAPCVAAMTNDGTFIFSTSPVYPEDKDIVRLLFVFDGNRVKAPGEGKILRGSLVSQLSGRSSLTLNLTDIGSKQFTPAEKIPAAGLLK